MAPSVPMFVFSYRIQILGWFIFGFHLDLQVGGSQDRQLNLELGRAPKSFTLGVAFMSKFNVVNLTSNYRLQEVME